MTVKMTMTITILEQHDNNDSNNDSNNDNSNDNNDND